MHWSAWCWLFELQSADPCSPPSSPTASCCSLLAWTAAKSHPHVRCILLSIGQCSSPSACQPSECVCASVVWFQASNVYVHVRGSSSLYGVLILSVWCVHVPFVAIVTTGRSRNSRHPRGWGGVRGVQEGGGGAHSQALTLHRSKALDCCASLSTPGRPHSLARRHQRDVGHLGSKNATRLRVRVVANCIASAQCTFCRPIM